MIQKKDIERMATLAKLEIKEDEMDFYINEVESMLDFVAKIYAEETQWVLNKTEPLDFNDMREDCAFESLDVSEILSNAKEREKGFFRLRKRA